MPLSRRGKTTIKCSSAYQKKPYFCLPVFTLSRTRESNPSLRNDVTPCLYPERFVFPCLEKYLFTFSFTRVAPLFGNNTLAFRLYNSITCFSLLQTTSASWVHQAPELFLRKHLYLQFIQLSIQKLRKKIPVCSVHLGKTNRHCLLKYCPRTSAC